MKPQIPWLRVFVEGVVIVGSILLAFGIQAWWDEVQEQDEEQRILMALERDFEATRANLLETAEGTLQVQDSIMLLLGLVSDPQASIPTERLNNLIQQSFWINRAEPRLSTYAEIVNSGSLRLIASDSLRQWMAVMEADLGDVQAWTDLLIQRWTTLEEPYLMEHTVIPELYQGYRNVEFPVVGGATDIDEFRTPEFINLISGRVIHLLDIVGNMNEVVADLDTVLALLDREIVR